MIITYRIPLYPNQNQINHLNQQFGCNRFIWNQLLDYSESFYQETKTVVNREILTAEIDESLKLFLVINTMTAGTSVTAR